MTNNERKREERASRMAHFNLQSRLQPIGRDNGFRMEDYWTWDGSIIEGEDGRWHMFASRWPKRYDMHPGWLFLSEVVRAVADRPEGPYTFEEVVFSPRESSYFDGRMTHNPSIRKCGDTYLLFYLGVTYGPDLPDDPAWMPTETVHETDLWCREVWLKQRIGLAVSKSVYGPWERPDRPILEPRLGKWDSGMVTNPTPFVMPDGSIYLAYNSGKVSKGTALTPFRTGIARADSWQGPFERVSDDPVYNFPVAETFVEDPFLWHADGTFHIIMKDLSGHVTGTKGYGLYLHSQDAVMWELGDPPIAYTRELQWKDGDSHEVGQFERPQLVFDREGVMTHITGATAYSEGDLQGVSDSWVTVVPLAAEA